MCFHNTKKLVFNTKYLAFRNKNPSDRVGAIEHKFFGIVFSQCKKNPKIVFLKNRRSVPQHPKTSWNTLTCVLKRLTVVFKKKFEYYVCSPSLFFAYFFLCLSSFPCCFMKNMEQIANTKKQVRNVGKKNKIFDTIFLTNKVVRFNTCVMVFLGVCRCWSILSRMFTIPILRFFCI